MWLTNSKEGKYMPGLKIRFGSRFSWNGIIIFGKLWR